MEKQATNLMQNLGRFDRLTGSNYGPVTGLLGKALMVGLPTYGLTRLLTPKVSKDYDPHRTGLAAAIAATGLMAAPQLSQMMWNARRSKGPVSKFMNLNAPIGVVPPNEQEMKGLADAKWQPTDYAKEWKEQGFDPATQFVKQEDYTGAADYNGAMRSGKLHTPPVALRGKTKLGEIIKRANNMGTAPTEGNSFESKPTHEESVSINDILERHRRHMKGKSKGKDICYSSSDVQPVIHPSDDEVMNKIVKDGSLNSWAEKAASLIKHSQPNMHMQNIKDVGSALAASRPISDFGKGTAELLYDRRPANTESEIAKGVQAKSVRHELPNKMLTGESLPNNPLTKPALDTHPLSKGVKNAMTRSLVEWTVDRLTSKILDGYQTKESEYDYGMAGGLGSYDTFLPPGSQGMGIPVHYTAQQIDNDPYMSPQEKSKALMLLSAASDGGRPGLISIGDVSRAAIGAGIGYSNAMLFGKVLGGIFGGLAPTTQKRLQQAGAVAGMLINTGVLR